MFASFVSWIVIVVILLAAGAMLLARDWRTSLGALGVQYLAVFWLVARHLPFVMASAKLITGWMVVAVLGMTRLGLSSAADESETPLQSRGVAFRVVLICIVALVSVGLTVRIDSVIPGIGLQVIAGSLLLIGIGGFQIGVTSDLLHIILGLLTMLMGFEVIYAAVESSILVTGLLAIVNLALGLTGSYLLVAGSVAQDAAQDESVEGEL